MISEGLRGDRRSEKHFGTYPAPKAQWSRSIPFGSLLDSAAVNVSSRKRSGLKTNLLRSVPFSALNKIKEGKRCIRVWIPLFVAMNVVTVQNKRRVLRDVHPSVHKVFGRGVWRRNPKWGVAAHHLTEQATREKVCRNGQALQRTSLIIARMYGRRCSSSACGQRSWPTTLLSSA
jgi:hypothetical protein